MAGPVDGVRRKTQQRRYPRKPVKTDVTYRYKNERMNRLYVGSGHTINLSVNGALIRIENYIPPRSEIDLYITTKNRKQIYTRSRIVHCHRIGFNLYEIGVQFKKVEKR